MVYVVLKKVYLGRFSTNEFVNIWLKERDAKAEVERLNEQGIVAFYIHEPVQ